MLVVCRVAQVLEVCLNPRNLLGMILTFVCSKMLGEMVYAF